MSEQEFLTKALNKTVMSRRSFLKLSAALGGTAVLAGGLSFGLKAVDSAVNEAEENGKWTVTVEPSSEPVTPDNSSNEGTEQPPQ